MEEKYCCAKGCRTKIPGDLVMCGWHWYRVPLEQRLHIIKNGYSEIAAEQSAKWLLGKYAKQPDVEPLYA
jgi:hypothetical protein